MPIDTLNSNGRIVAIIIPHNFSETGLHFVTPHDFSQQLAYMHHPAGRHIDPHVHNPVPRAITYTQEVLIIKRGRLRVDFYDDDQRYLESRILQDGDLILLASGGHGFEVLEEVEMFEVKQGPYAEHEDKTRFDGISSEKAIVKGSGG